MARTGEENGGKILAISHANGTADNKSLSRRLMNNINLLLLSGGGW